MKFIYVVISLVILPCCLSAQSWKSLNDSLIQYYQKGDYNKAIGVGKRAIGKAKQEFGEYHANYAESLNNLAVVYQAADSSYKAVPLLIQVISIQKKVLGDTHPDYAKGIYNLAVLYEDLRLYEKAIPLYIQLKDVYRKVLGENHPDYASRLNDLAMLYDESGQYEKAEPLYLEAMDINKKAEGENSINFAKSLNNLASLYKAKGRYDKAEPLYIRALDIKKIILDESDPDYATSLDNLGQMYQEMGQYEKAEPLLTKAMEIRKLALGENDADYANSLNSLAVFYQLTGRYSKAEPFLIQALDIRRKVLGDGTPEFATSLNNLAIFYQALDKYEKAEPLLVQALDISRRNFGEMHPDYAESLNNLAVLYQAMGNYQKAEQLYIQAIGINKKILGDSHPDYALNIDNLALLYQARGQYEKAEPLALLNSSIVVQNLRKTFTVLSEKEKGRYLENNSVVIESNNSFLYYHRNASNAFITNNFNLQLFFKSLLLNDSRIMLETVSHSRDSTIGQLFNDWQMNKTLLSRQYSLPISSRRPDLGNIEANTETLEKELARKSASFRDQNSMLQINMKKVQEKMEPDEAVIEFVRFDLFNKKWTDSIMYGAYILRKNDLVPVFVSLCEENQLQKLFDSAGNNTTSMVNQFYRGITVSLKNASSGKELYNLIWQPLEPYLKGIKKIAYSPAGKIYSVALQALSMDSTHLLMDKYLLQQYSSTRQIALRNTEKLSSKPGSIVLFGNASFTMDSLQMVTRKDKTEKISTSIYTPEKRGSSNNVWADLPGTAEEVNKIKHLFAQNKVNASSYVQLSATEENLKQLNSHSPQVLHIATHGFFLPPPGSRKKGPASIQNNTYTIADDPLLRSGLMFAGCNYAWGGKTPIDGVEDGIATAYEISQLNLGNTDLVVLSACETALGDVKGNEGVFGLQRAFKMAGVKKMIVSLWQVPDKETAELMTTFYANWFSGKTIAESFYRAQSEMRKKYSPFYWAAFVLVE